MMAATQAAGGKPAQCKHTRNTGDLSMERCSHKAVRDGYCTRHHPDHVPPSQQVHLHEDQFDGWLHASCGARDVQAPDILVVPEDEFCQTPSRLRCRKCEQAAFPHGVMAPYDQ